MKVVPLELPEVLRLEPDVFTDDRGFFLETWSQQRYHEAGLPETFVQDNLSWSNRGVLRGLHLQAPPHAQGKLVCVLHGEAFDVAIDVRLGSPTFGRWVGETLSLANRRQLWIPAGFAHGFCATSEACLFAYKCTHPYRPDAELGIAWDDAELAIPWPITGPRVSDRDRAYPTLAVAATSERWPTFAPDS